MLWLKILFLVVIFISQMYVIQFQSSDEAKDKEGEKFNIKQIMCCTISYL